MRTLLQDIDGRRCKIGNGGPFGEIYVRWSQLQHGQERLFRWGPYLDKFPGKLRRQSGHDHCCSITFLVKIYLIRMRSYVRLDELLIHDCVRTHDIPEGFNGVDKPAPKKRGLDDLKEYLIFKDYFSGLGDDVWKEMQKAFLLQFALENPSCFPSEAQEIIGILAKENRNEALFFKGIERLDYLLYAYECAIERKVDTLLKDVARNQVGKMNKIAEELPGFREVIWTPTIQSFFEKAAQFTLER